MQSYVEEYPPLVQLSSIGHSYEGRAYKPSVPAILGRFGNDPTEDRARVEWLVHAPKGGAVKITARHDRAGTIRAEVSL